MTLPKEFPADGYARDKQHRVLGRFTSGKTGFRTWSGTLADGSSVKSTDKGVSWERMGDTAPPASASQRDVKFILAVQDQQIEKFHWSLFVAPEGGTGDIYQVNGDPSARMTPNHTTNKNVTASRTYMANMAIVINGSITAAQHALINQAYGIFSQSQYVPANEPVARPQHNCQTWAIDVLTWLNSRDPTLVSSSALKQVKRAREYAPWMRRTPSPEPRGTPPRRVSPPAQGSYRR